MITYNTQLTDVNCPKCLDLDEIIHPLYAVYSLVNVFPSFVCVKCEGRFLKEKGIFIYKGNANDMFKLRTPSVPWIKLT